MISFGAYMIGASLLLAVAIHRAARLRSLLTKEGIGIFGAELVIASAIAFVLSGAAAGVGLIHELRSASRPSHNGSPGAGDPEVFKGYRADHRGR